MLRIHFSNDTGQLTELLLDRLAEPPPSSDYSPFDAEHIIVPGAGMRRHLELRHADRFGIAANLNFSYPAQWIWQRIARALNIPGDDSPYSAEVMSWRLLRWLDSGKRHRGARLNAWLAHADAVMRYELAQRVARHLEQLVTYRPDWLEAWAAHQPARLPGASAAQRDDEAWLAEAWREIVRATDGPVTHPAETLLTQLATLDADGMRSRGLPSRVAVFGLPELPPLYLDFMTRLALFIDVDFYVFNPCAEFWFDIVSPQRRARLEARGKVQHSETGNTLLAHWGEQTKAFIETIVAQTEDETVDAFVEIEPDSSLHCVQHAILTLQELEADSLRLDDSIAIHVCHSMARQVEVLHDQLLARFDADATLQPGDVLVLVPALDDAAPSIDAVFGTIAPGADHRHIPYRITGLGARSGAPLTRTLFTLLELHTSRFEASAIFGLLQQTAIARRFGLEGEALDLVHRWIRDSGIRWGRDADHRAALGLPATTRHTFADGLKQLMLGYAMPLPDGEDFADCLPYGDIEGQRAWWLGGFWQFHAQLGELADDLPRARTAAEWAATISQILKLFFEPAPEDLNELLRLRAAVADLARLSSAGGADDMLLPIEIISRALEERVAEQVPGGSASGALTFTGMTPLRQLPFRLICVLGLDHGVFPGEARSDEFDLMTAFGRKGDRQRRRDDRNVFLDVLLCARDALYLSYTGRNGRDNSVMLPSLVLSELLDVLVAAALPAGCSSQRIAEAEAVIVTVHPAQAFSKRYFDQGHARLFSYNPSYRDAAADAAHAALHASEDGAPAAVATFFSGPLAPAETGWRKVSLTTLIRFLRQPSRFLLQQRLRIGLESDDDGLLDDEPFSIEDRERWNFRDRILAMAGSGRDAQQIARAAHLLNQVPTGMLGELEVEPILQQARAFHERIAAARGTDPHEPLAVRFTLGDFTVDGALAELSERGLLLSNFQNTSAGSLLEAWVKHLALCLAQPPGVALRTQWITQDAGFHLHAVDDAAARLHDLLNLYWTGLHGPVHFFPRSAHAFATTKKISEAEKKWHSDFKPEFCESKDPSYQLIFGDDLQNVLDERFEQLALRVFEPLLAAWHEGIHDDFS